MDIIKAFLEFLTELFNALNAFIGSKSASISLGSLIEGLGQLTKDDKTETEPNA